MGSTMTTFPSLHVLAVSSAGSKHPHCAGRAGLGYQLVSWAVSDLTCRSNDWGSPRGGVFALAHSLQRALKSD